VSAGHVALPLKSLSAPKFSLDGWIATQSRVALAAQEEQRVLVLSRLPEWVGDDAAEVARILNLNEAIA
jgi:hypothetical protein